MGFEWVVLIGAREAEAGTVTLKNMKSSESQVVAITDIASAITA
jgi:histidyl-tRNA synthetase